MENVCVIISCNKASGSKFTWSVMSLAVHQHESLKSILGELLTYFFSTVHVNLHTPQQNPSPSCHHRQDKLTAPLLLFPVTLNLLKHVIHAYLCFQIHNVISPPHGSVHIPIQNIFPDPAVQHRDIATLSKHSGLTYPCWFHIPMCFSFYLSPLALSAGARSSQLHLGCIDSSPRGEMVVFKTTCWPVLRWKFFCKFSNWAVHIYMIMRLQ